MEIMWLEQMSSQLFTLSIFWCLCWFLRNNTYDEVWGGMAIAAAFAAAVTTAIPRQMPQGGADATTPEVLLIALDQPVVDLSLAPSQKNLN